MQSFAAALHLPFYDRGSDQNQVSHRVVWAGSDKGSLRALPGLPDGIAYAHEFCVVIEATRMTGTRQWSQEFCQCLRHARNVAATTAMGPQNVYTILITEHTHDDTYTAVRSRNRRCDFCVLPLETDLLARVLETSILAFTLRHLDLRDLVNDMLGCLERSTDACDFRRRADTAARAWQKKVLDFEKPVVVAVKSYEAMLRIGRDHVGVGEILAHLLKHPVLRRYFRIMESEMRPETIVASLQSESLGSVCGRLLTGEELFCPVPLSDYKSRCARRQAAVEEANA